MALVWQTIAADHRARMRHHTLHVVFAHLEVARAAGLQAPTCRLIDIPLGRDFAEQELLRRLG
jgi:hypothetical protein